MLSDYKLQTKTGKIDDLLRPTAEALGFDLVQIKFSGGGRAILQILAERHGGGMNVDDCARLNRELSVILDVEDPVDGGYSLEVSSPGLDRPLVKIEDYDRFKGKEAKIELCEPVAGRRRWIGHLMGINNGNVQINASGEEVLIPFEEITKAKLIFEGGQ